MKSIYRLKKNYQYNFVYKHAVSVSDKNFIMLYCASRCNPTKVGFSVSKKFGKAVCRNRIRRQMKAAVSQFVERLVGGYNIVFIPRQQHGYVYSDVIGSVGALLAKARLLK